MTSASSIGISPVTHAGGIPTGGAAATARRADGNADAPDSRLGLDASLIQDAIHHRLGTRSPPAARKPAIDALRQAIQARLAPTQTDAGAGKRTGFGRIAEAPGGMYTVTLADGSTHLRSAEEAELHVLLQSAVSAAERLAPDPADCIDPAQISSASVVKPAVKPAVTSTSKPAVKSAVAPAAAPAATPAPSPPATAGDAGTLSKTVGSADSLAPATPARDDPAHDRSAHLGDGIPATTADYRYFLDNAVDIPRLEAALLHGGTHRQQEISAEGNNCWWRSGMSSILRQKDQASLRLALQDGMGDACAAVASEVTTLCEMAEAVHAGNAASIMTDHGRLTLPNGADADHVARAENACKAVIRNLLRQAGARSEVIDRAIDNPAEINGDSNLLRLLFQQLGCSYACFSFARPATPAQPDVAALDAAPAGIEIEFAPDSAFHNLPPDADTGECTDNILRAIHEGRLCVLINRSLHFNFAQPL